MLMKRVIPCLDVHEGRVVKGVNFVNLRDAGDPVEMAAVYDKAKCERCSLLDQCKPRVAGDVSRYLSEAVR